MRVSRALKRMTIVGLLALLAFAPGMLLPGTAKADGDVPVAGEDYAIDQFYDELAPYGDWVYREDHGYVWLPREVEPEWRPFTVGKWISTEYGWYWESYEPFAWAVYHYGRWGFDPEYGWYWVPGDTWAPAWVQWRYGNEYVGWAPEPPAYNNYAYGAPAQYTPPPPPRESWVFVEPRYLVAPAVRRYALPRTSVSIFISSSTYVYRPQYRNGYVYNFGMPRDRWSRLTGRHIEPRRIHRGHSRKRPADWDRRYNRDVYAYAPNVRKGVGPRHPPKKVAHRRGRPKAANAPTRRELYAGRGQGRGGLLGVPYSVGTPGQIKRPDRKQYGGQGHPGRKQHVGKPQGNGGPHGKHVGKLKGGKPDGARSKAARANHQQWDRTRAGPNRGGGRPDQANRQRDGKPHAGKPPAVKPHAGQPRGEQPRPGQPRPGRQAGKPDDGNAKAQRNRSMSLAPPARDVRRPAQVHPPRGTPRSNANAARANGGKPKADKPAAGKPRASKPKPPASNNARAPNAKPKAVHARPQAAYAKPKPRPAARSKPSKPKMHARPQPKPKAKAVHAKPRPKPKAKPKAVHAKPKPRPSAKHRPRAKPKAASVHRGGAKRGGGKRAAACKGKRGCGRRG
jgi:uncharacterized protein DUF6600